MLWQRNQLIAQPFRFNIMGLQYDQLLKIRMHLRLSFSTLAAGTITLQRKTRSLAPHRSLVKYAP
jgi:hypothetical protein